MCQGFSNLAGILHHFEMAKLGFRVKDVLKFLLLFDSQATGGEAGGPQEAP